MFNKMVIVSVTPFSGTTDTDKNGSEPVMLQCIAGTIPNRNVLSGTIAHRLGIEVGKTYLMSVREAGYDKVFGPDFQWVKIKEILTAEDTIRAAKEIGEALVLNIDRPEGYENNYVRKTNAVEGLRTERIKSGDYIPVQKRNYSHETAPEIKEGTSVTGEKENLFGKELPESNKKSEATVKTGEEPIKQ